MKRSLLVGLALVAVLLTAGCFPALYARRPGVSGVVLDSQSQTSVAGARVVICPMRYSSELIKRDLPLALRAIPSDPHRAPVITNQKGQFSIPVWREFGMFSLWFPIEDVKESGGILIVYQEGYEPNSLDLRQFRKLNRIKLASPILLEPITK